jgi:peptidoglycan/xylan/chitin deacetylase (PgdA/CDA1 family)
VVGSQAANNQSLVRREFLEGHKVANHTYLHPNLTQLSSSQVASEFSQTNDAVISAGAARPTEWRPPYGAWNDSVRSIATSQGMSMVMWTDATNSYDFNGTDSPQVIRDRVINNVTNGAILIFHDLFAPTADAMPLVLDGLAQKNFCVAP